MFSFKRQDENDCAISEAYLELLAFSVTSTAQPHSYPLPPTSNSTTTSPHKAITTFNPIAPYQRLLTRVNQDDVNNSP